jgi:uncharacterized protein YggE
MFRLCLITLALLLSTIGCATVAAQQPRFIEVVGRGKISALPDRAEMTVVLSKQDASSAKALKKFNELKGKFNTALNPMNFEGIELEFGNTEIGPVLQQDAMMMVEDVEQVEKSFGVSENVKVIIGGLTEKNEDEITKLLVKLVDEVSEQGGQLNQNTPNPFGWQTMPNASTKYLITDTDAMQQEGEVKAMKHARVQGERLALLAEAKLGKVISIVQVDPALVDDAQGMQEALMSMYGMSEETQDFTSNTFGKIEMEFALKVRFELIDE